MAMKILPGNLITRAKVYEDYKEFCRWFVVRNRGGRKDKSASVDLQIIPLLFWHIATNILLSSAYFQLIGK